MRPLLADAQTVAAVFAAACEVCDVTPTAFKNMRAVGPDELDARAVAAMTLTLAVPGISQKEIAFHLGYRDAQRIPRLLSRTSGVHCKDSMQRMRSRLSKEAA